MPDSTAKQQRRRDEVIHAACQIILEDGLDAVSVRTVAKRLGCTTGVVMYYFRTKDELILLALRRLWAYWWRKIQSEGKDHEGLQQLILHLRASMPTTSGMIAGWRVWLAFIGYAVGRPKLMTEVSKHYANLRSYLIKELKVLQSQNLLRKDLDLHSEANALISLVDGISVGRIIDDREVRLKDIDNMVFGYLEGIIAKNAQSQLDAAKAYAKSRYGTKRK